MGRAWEIIPQAVTSSYPKTAYHRGFLTSKPLSRSLPLPENPFFQIKLLFSIPSLH